MRIATIGAAFSANKGAASMLRAVIDGLPPVVGPCRFDVLTTYPRDDALDLDESGAGGAVEIVSCRPWELVFPMLPLALLVALIRLFGGRGRWLCITPALRALAEADVVLDLAGISFADGRRFPILVYNVLMTGIPLLVSGQVVKCSQALGPFRRALNRAAARAVLPHLAAVVARGRETEGHLEELGLENLYRAADLAYTLTTEDGAADRADSLLREVLPPGEGAVVGVIPSMVVGKYCRTQGIDYVEVMAHFVSGLASDGHRVLLLCHAARPDRPASHMNDLPLIREIRDNAGSDAVGVLDRSLSPTVLRQLVGACDVLVTARFHGMISALATATPVLVVGWSHKYREALAEFGLEEWLVSYRELDARTLTGRTDELLAAAASLERTIRSRLPAVTADARRNFDVIRSTLAGAFPSSRSETPEVRP